MPTQNLFVFSANQILFKLEDDHFVEDICDDFADVIFDVDDIDRPVLPLHPNCKCYWENNETGEYLGQDIFY